MEEKIKVMREMLEIQGAPGNWDYSPYMQGLYNGMEYMMSLLENREPIFREPPEVWGEDIPLDLKVSSEPVPFKVIRGGKE